MFYVYILRCSDNSLYCGQTNNLKRRVKEHNFDENKSAKYLRYKKPVILVYSEEYPTLALALKRESQIKKLTKVKKEALIACNMKPNYKFSFSGTKKVHKFGVDIAVYGGGMPTANVVYEETEKGHFEEFYSDTSTYMWFVVEGKGTFVIDDERVEVGTKDLIVVPPKKRIHYFGKMKMVLCVTPAFDEKNEHHVRDISLEESPHD